MHGETLASKIIHQKKEKASTMISPTKFFIPPSKQSTIPRPKCSKTVSEISDLLRDFSLWL
jgi:hypothetical protein